MAANDVTDEVRKLDAVRPGSILLNAWFAAARRPATSFVTTDKMSLLVDMASTREAWSSSARRPISSGRFVSRKSNTTTLFSSSVYPEGSFSPTGCHDPPLPGRIARRIQRREPHRQIASALQARTVTAFMGMQTPVNELPCLQDWCIEQACSDSFRFLPDEERRQRRRLCRSMPSGG